LGTSSRTGGEVRKTALDRRYLIRYLLAKWFQGAWREPTFLYSSLGRLFLKEGYSAGVMRAIYDRDEKRHGPLDRVFLEYPLHRAVYDRLQILTKRMEAELEARLRTGREVRVFTGPSGFAYDVFRPLEAIAARRPELMDRVEVVAADLDPHVVLADELAGRAGGLGVRFHFLRGDMTDEEMRQRFAEKGPYDMAVFIGLSAWLPKPGVLNHLRWLRENLREGGVLITDSFTPEAYALSGRYVGYKASYYEPEVYRALVDYCGFDGLGAEVESGRDGINHVLIASPRIRRQP
jgi:SAM-dependent methyltransferase